MVTKDVLIGGAPILVGVALFLLYLRGRKVRVGGPAKGRSRGTSRLRPSANALDADPEVMGSPSLPPAITNPGGLPELSSGRRSLLGDLFLSIWTRAKADLGARTHSKVERLIRSQTGVLGALSERKDAEDDLKEKLSERAREVRELKAETKRTGLMRKREENLLGYESAQMRRKRQRKKDDDPDSVDERERERARSEKVRAKHRMRLDEEIATIKRMEGLRAKVERERAARRLRSEMIRDAEASTDYLNKKERSDTIEDIKARFKAEIPGLDEEE